MEQGLAVAQVTLGSWRVLPSLRPASGVSATMIQNVGNHLRRVWRAC